MFPKEILLEIFDHTNFYIDKFHYELLANDIYKNCKVDYTKNKVNKKVGEINNLFTNDINLTEYNNLTSISFRYYFNNPVDKLLHPICEKLTSLKFGKRFNQSIDILQNCTNLVNLELGSHYDQDINNLPNNLIKLRLGGFFHKSISIPNNLKYLVFELMISDNDLKYTSHYKKIRIVKKFLPRYDLLDLKNFIRTTTMPISSYVFRYIDLSKLEFIKFIYYRNCE